MRRGDRIRRMGVLAGALLLAPVLVACRPLPPREIANGRLLPSTLTEITPQCRVVNELAQPLRSMLEAAHGEGVALEPEQSSLLPPGTPGPPVIESCYRSYDGQVWWRNYYCSIGKCPNAAVPGTSKHGWGRAVDFQDQNGEMAFGSPGYVWLQAHAGEYGFFHPPHLDEGQPNAEAWHWEG